MSRTDQPAPCGDVVELELRCPSDTRMLAPVRAMATTLARQQGFSAEQIDQIEMAVDEACANVVRHAYRHLGISPDLTDKEKEVLAAERASAGDCTIGIRMSLGEDRLVFQVIDNGIGIDNTPPGVSGIDEFVERGGGGGLGLLIIRNFMDEVRYDQQDGQGTILTMTKYLGIPGESPSQSV